MQCDRFTERLHDLLDERADPTQDEQLGQHARSCPHCRRQLGSWAAVQSCLGAPPAAGQPAGWGWSIAMVLVAAGVLGWMMARPDATTDERVAVSPAVVSAAPSEAAPVPSIDALLVELEAGQLPRWQFSQWAVEAWGPMLEGIRPVTGSLNVAVRAFSPASVHLQLEPADQAQLSVPLAGLPA